MSVQADGDGAAAAQAWCHPPNDIRVRFAGQFPDAGSAEILLSEVEALYCAGPAGGAGLRRHATPRLISASCLIERNLVTPIVSFLGAAS